MRTPVPRNPDETDLGLPRFTATDIWHDLRDAVRATLQHLFAHSMHTCRLHRHLCRHLGPTRVSVGAGRTVPDQGWVGDFRKGPRVYRCDLRKSLPFHDGTVDVVLAEHIVEHSWFSDAFALFRELFRILRQIRMAYEFDNHKALLTEQALVGLAAGVGFTGIKTTIGRSIYFASPPETHLAHYPDGILEAVVIEAVRPPSAPDRPETGP